jgi:CIC family chloride channel protein
MWDRKFMKVHLRYAAAIFLVAIGAATFAIAFRLLLARWYEAAFQSRDVVTAISTLPVWLRIGVPAFGAAGAGILSRLRRSSQQGVSNVMEAVVLGNLQLSARVTLSRVASAWLAIAGGMSIGREGPLIEFGGTLGAKIGQRMQTPSTQTRVLVAAGTAAGFASAYNTPFAAVLFVLETIVGVAAPAALLPAIASTVLATLLTRTLVGPGPIYGQRSFVMGSSADLPMMALLAVAAAGAATAFKWVLHTMEDWVERHPLKQPLRAACGGALVGIVAVWLPQVAGNGYEPLNAMLDGRTAVSIVGALLLAKIVVTSGSVASGVPGGIFTPMLLAGAALGTLWANAVTAITDVPANPGSYALVGMAATTAASIHAPLTAAVMVFELSGDYPIAVPLLLATVLATVSSRLLGSESVYEAELSRRGLAWDLTLEGREIRKR